MKRGEKYDGNLKPETKKIISSGRIVFCGINSFNVK